MARLAAAAVAQLDALFDHYMQRERDEAVLNPRAALGEALATIDANPLTGRRYPSTYRGLARWGYRWIKVHRYWFAYAIDDGEAVVANILFETSDIPRRAVPRRRDG